MSDSAAQHSTTAKQTLAADPQKSVWLEASAGSGKTTILITRLLRLVIAGAHPRSILTITYTLAAAVEIRNRLGVIASKLSKLDDQALLAEITALAGGVSSGIGKGHASKVTTIRENILFLTNNLHVLQIMTFHAFCLRLLRIFPLEAGLPPDFSLHSETDSKRQLAAAITGVFANKQQLVSERDDQDEKALLTNIANKLSQSKLTKYFQQIVNKRFRLNDQFEKFNQQQLGEILRQQLLSLTALSDQEVIDYLHQHDPEQHDWQLVTGWQPPWQLQQVMLQQDLLIKRWAAQPIDESCQPAKLKQRRCLYSLQTAQQKSLASVDKRSAYSKLQLQLDFLSKIKKSRAKQLPENPVLIELNYLACSLGLITVMQQSIQQFQSAKRRLGELDFEDLIAITYRLLYQNSTPEDRISRLISSPITTNEQAKSADNDNPDSAPAADNFNHAPIDNFPTFPWVMYKLDGEIKHILIDEAQDLAPRQWRIVEVMLTNVLEHYSASGNQQPPPSLFVVGDFKQSIFAFQGADPHEFIFTCKRLSTIFQQFNRKLEIIPLNVNYRSSQSILDFVDATFAQIHQQLGVGKWQPHYRQGKAATGGVTIFEPLIQSKKSKANITSGSAFVDLLDSALSFASNPEESKTARNPDAKLDPAHSDSETLHSPAPAAAGVTESDTTSNNPSQVEDLVSANCQRLINYIRQHRIPPEDTLILLPRRSAYQATLSKMLYHHRIPQLGQDRFRLGDDGAVIDLRMALMACHNLRDDYALACLLRSPLVEVSDQYLQQLVMQQQQSLWESLQQQDDGTIVNWLVNLASAAHGQGILTLLHRLLATPCPAPCGRKQLPIPVRGNIPNIPGKAALLYRYGEQSRDAIDELLLLAATADASGAGMLDFIAELDKNDFEIKREFDAAQAKGIRILTAHAAKGQESPVVILPDLDWPGPGNFQLDEVIWWQGLPLPKLRQPLLPDSIQQKLLQQQQHEKYQEMLRLLYVAMTRAQQQLVIMPAYKPVSSKTSDNRKYQTWFAIINAAQHQLQAAGSKHVNSEIGNYWLFGNQSKFSATVTRPVPTGKIPEWLVPQSSQAPLQTPPADAKSTKITATNISETQAASLQRGQGIHACLALSNTIYPLPEQQQQLFIQKIIALFCRDQSRDLQKASMQEVLSVLNNSKLRKFLCQKDNQFISNEQDWLAPNARTRVLRPDRMIIDKQTVFLVDFKTHRKPPETVQLVNSTILQQIAEYYQLATSRFPNHAIVPVIIWTATSTCMILQASDFLDTSNPMCKTGLI